MKKSPDRASIPVLSADTLHLLDAGENIEKVAEVDMILQDDAKPALKFLHPRLYRVKFGKEGRPGHHWELDVLGGALAAHVDDDTNLTLVRNTRFPLIKEGVSDGASIELPGGGITSEDAERIEHAPREEVLRILGLTAAREFEEEVGIRLHPDSLTHLDTMRLAVGFSNLKISTFHATGGTPTEQSHDNGEAGLLKVFKLPLSDAQLLVEDGMIQEAATKSAVTALAHEYGIPIAKKLNLQKTSFPTYPKQ